MFIHQLVLASELKYYYFTFYLLLGYSLNHQSLPSQTLVGLS